jgi:hypothetical protein
VEDRGQARDGIIPIAGGDAIWTRQRRATAQGIVAKSETRVLAVVNETREPIQGVVPVRRAKILRIGHRSAVGCSVVAVLDGLCTGQKSIRGVGFGQTVHVVVGERICACGIRYLGQPTRDIVRVVHGAAVRIAFLKKVILIIVVIGRGLRVPVGFVPEIVVVVPIVGFVVAGGKDGLLQLMARVIGKARVVVVGVLDVGEIAFRIASPCVRSDSLVT